MLIIFVLNQYYQVKVEVVRQCNVSNGLDTFRLKTNRINAIGLDEL
jgi:hypothetical protein